MKNEWLFNLLVALLTLIAVAIFATQTKAQNVLAFQGVLCDTREQITDLLDRMTRGEDPQKAMNEVNKAAGKEMACGFAQAIVILSEPMGVTINGKRAQIVELTVIPHGLQQWAGRFLDKLATFNDA